jgi:hypothetical protein
MMKKIIACKTTALGFILNGVICSLLPSLVCQVIASFIELVPKEDKNTATLVELYNTFAGLSGISVEEKMRQSFEAPPSEKIQQALALYQELSKRMDRQPLPGMLEMIEALKAEGYTTFTTTANDRSLADSQTAQVPGLKGALSHVFSLEDGKKPHFSNLVSSCDHIVTVFDAGSELQAASKMAKTQASLTLNQIGFVVSFTLDDLVKTFNDVLAKASEVRELDFEELSTIDLTEANLNAFSLEESLTGEDLSIVKTFQYQGIESAKKLKHLIEITVK